MGLIDSAISGAMEAVGSGMMDAGNFFLKGGYSVWGNFSKVAMRYVQQQPESLGAWQVVTGSVYTLSTGIAASWMDAQFRRNPEQFFHRRGF